MDQRYYSLILAFLVLITCDGIKGVISAEEGRAIALQYMPEIDRERMECKLGQFYSYETETCKSCDRNCGHSVDLISCGFECQSYFAMVNLTAKLHEQESLYHVNASKSEQKEQELIGQITTWQGVAAGIFTVFAVITIILLVCLVKSKRRYAKLRKSRLGIPLSDEGGYSSRATGA